MRGLVALAILAGVALILKARIEHELDALDIFGDWPAVPQESI